MNAELLLQHFERLSEAPDAIPRLRRFILDLAVRGKLVEQDPNDEPAMELLKKIQDERNRLIKEKKIKKSVSLDNLSLEENPFELPSNWIWTRLGEIGDWGSGSTPPRGNSEFYDGEITWLKSGELGDSTILVGSEERVSELALQKCSFRLNQPGDVLIAMYGATIGKLAILAEPAVTNQAVCGCTPVSGVYNKYLFLFLLSRRANFHSRSEGGAQPNISRVKIVSSPFALPPLSEQHRIVVKVDELMALCDQLEAEKSEREQSRDRLVAASLQRLNQPADDEEAFREDARFAFNHLPRLTTRPAHIKQLRQTILNLAVRGKLVLQNPNDEPALDLLKRIQAKKTILIKEGKLRKTKSLSSVTDEDFEFEKPLGWIGSRLGEIYDVRDGTHDTPKYIDSGYPLVTSKNLSSGKLSFDDIKFISEQDHRQISERSLVEKDDILLAMIGSIGNPVIVDTDREFSIKNVALFKYYDKSDAHPGFLRIYLKHAANKMQELAAGGLQPFVSLGFLRSYPFALPPLSEQHRIVAKVDELMTLCDQLEAQLTTTEADSRRLLEAVLHEALAPALEKEA